MSVSISRRQTLKLLRNVGVATFAGGALFSSRRSLAQQATAVLGHFGSANPQTFAKATGAFAKAFGGGRNDERHCHGQYCRDRHHRHQRR